MLRSNVLFVLSFIFCLNFVKSSPGYDEVVKIYKKQLRYEGLFITHVPEPKLSYDTVCNWPKEKLADLCKIVIRRLRHDNKEIYNNFYTSYLSYSVHEPCTDVKVWINLGDKLVHQTAVSCFTRPAIMAFDSSEEMAIFYRKIVLYPWNNQHVMVFEYNENKNYYTLTKYYRIQRMKLTYAVGSLFYTPMPLGRRNIRDLYSILYPIHLTLNHYSLNENNIVNTKNTLTLLKICYVAFRVENYDTEFNYNGRYKKLLPHELRATLRGPASMFNLSVSIMAYKCDRSVSKDTTLMSKYYVAAGPGVHSVILLEEVENDSNGHPRYEIIEIIEYLTEGYISFYFHASY